LRIDTHYQYYQRDGNWNFEPVKTTTRIADGTLDVTSDKPARISLPVNFGRYRLDVASADPNGPETSVDFDAAGMSTPTPIRPTCSKSRSTSPNTAPATP